MFLDGSSPWAWTAAASVLVVIFWQSQAQKRRRLPPGPPPLPILGNALDVPRHHLGLEFWKMTQKYGDLVYLNALGKSMLVIGSQKRSANYSDRPCSVMAELTKFDRMFAVRCYGERWRLHRRVFHEAFNVDVVSQFQPVQLNSARRFLLALLNSHHDIAARLKFSIASNLMRVAYGIDMTEENDKYFDMVERISETGEAISVPGRFPVEAIPSLLYLPRGFLAEASRRWPARLRRTSRRIDLGAARESFVSRLLDDASKYDLERAGERDLKSFIGDLTITIYAGTSPTICLSVCPDPSSCHGDVPRRSTKGQEELDRVIGADRLPDFSDRESLPYLGALLKELMRWHVITPIALPHAVMEDDIYNGYLIPGGTAVAVNVWAIARDPELYPDPDAFLPERKPGPSEWAFGFGRRICPGLHFAEAFLFIYVASILHAFSMRRPSTPTGLPSSSCTTPRRSAS
ncbi:cytochrome P450 98A3 [Epithele typhae]|uniref:cytochrome P450 98A3 n=1 Tax=Epithele typhae TaxID=378194 RepID=UPI00200751F2|nr:cytochrome P450 98A3 [Epithele typhae]KAH9935163.1 cytochrome P450 98A3 [Epithele typhae]